MDREISRLPDASAISGEELLGIVQNAETRKTSFDDMVSFFQERLNVSGDSSYIRTSPTNISVGGVNEGEVFNGTISDALDRLFYPFVFLEVEITATPMVIEQGVVANIIIDVVIDKNSEDILLSTLKRNGIPITTSILPTFSYTDIGLNADATYSVEVETATNVIYTQEVSVDFIPPTFFGVDVPNLLPFAIQTLSKVINNANNISRTFTGTNIVIYFAYPQSFGELNSIIDMHGLVVTDGFLQRTATFTLANGDAVNYYIYEFKNPTTIDTFGYTFNFQ